MCQDGWHSCMASCKCGEKHGEERGKTFETENCTQLDLGSRGECVPFMADAFPWKHCTDVGLHLWSGTVRYLDPYEMT